MATSKLPRDPLQPPPARPQPQHLRHIVRRLHHLPPWIFPRRGFHDSLLVHSLSPQLAKEGAIPRGAEGAVFHGARHQEQLSGGLLFRERTADSRTTPPTDTNCVARHIGFEPPNPDASYLIGFE